MTAIGSLVFCNDCGNLLDSSTTHKRTTLKCDVCGSVSQDTSVKSTFTQSKPTDFPSALRAKRSLLQVVNDNDVQSKAMIRETCQKCGTEEVRYHEQQLRSADEGSTIFFHCPKCNHKWTQNN